jgi:DNA-binding CsgD family transcriptional regulator
MTSIVGETTNNVGQILVVGAERITAEAVARAIDPYTDRASALPLDEAIAAIHAGNVKIVVLIPRGVDSGALIAAITKVRGIHLVIAASGVTPPPTNSGEIRPFVAGTLDEVLKHVNDFIAITTDVALTDRHIDILQRLAVGDTPTEAAVALGITVKTLNNHLGVVYRRLATRNVTQAVLTALRAGLIELR